jgi:hypothetical protein
MIHNSKGDDDFILTENTDKKKAQRNYKQTHYRWRDLSFDNTTQILIFQVRYGDTNINIWLVARHQDDYYYISADSDEHFECVGNVTITELDVTNDLDAVNCIRLYNNNYDDGKIHGTLSHLIDESVIGVLLHNYSYYWKWLKDTYHLPKFMNQMINLDPTNTSEVLDNHYETGETQYDADQEIMEQTLGFELSNVPYNSMHFKRNLHWDNIIVDKAYDGVKVVHSYISDTKKELQLYLINDLALIIVDYMIKVPSINVFSKRRKEKWANLSKYKLKVN